jgi:hypothetical protein
MTDRLKQAFDKAAATLLPEDQDQFADYLLKLLDADDEGKWDATFAATGEKLDKLAQQAIDDYRAGRTDPEKL